MCSVHLVQQRQHPSDGSTSISWYISPTLSRNWANPEWICFQFEKYHSINNVDNRFTNELQTIPLILNMYIRRKKIHYTSTFRQSCCLSLRFHSPPSALLSLATCLERAKTFNPGLKFSETDLQSEHLLFHVLTHLVSTAWWFYWRWSEKKRFTSCSFCIIFFTSCSPASLQFPFYTITRSWSQMMTFSRIS